MPQEQIVKVENVVRDQMAKHDKAHDWEHIRRVRDTALRIAETEGGNKTLIEIAALVHDIGDRKFHESEEAGQRAIQGLLTACGVDSQLQIMVMDIAHRVSFKGVGVPDDMPTLEGKIVQDADRLDAIGAIAIARTFTWGGAKGRPIYDPTKPVFKADTAEEYFANGETSINHFYEKLLHLKDRIHTQTARDIAETRHAFMEAYLVQFKKEWEAKD